MLGALAPVMSLEDRDILLQSAIKYYVNGRLEAVINQLKEGLETLDVLNSIKNNPDTFKPMFVGGGKPLTASEMMSMFRVSYSEVGSNRRAAEEMAISHWRDWLIDVELGDAVIITEDGEENITLSLENVLVFASGASTVPPFGFPCRPSLEFLHAPLNGSMPVFPQANSCGIVLYLPLHNTYEEFSKWMAEGIIQSPTFGFA
ncbi:hypothetical protein UPYG_G00115050 [Umbra pygmaea]|uniref:HECT domain-containing protein n=1 Tax=Umbra pygmaea TaxID=75934 RepID=A0ABD0XL24_UMBPY